MAGQLIRGVAGALGVRISGFGVLVGFVACAYTTEGATTPKHQAPSTKLQRSPKHQFPNRERSFWKVFDLRVFWRASTRSGISCVVLDLELGIWIFSGAWSLELGASGSPKLCLMVFTFLAFAY